MTNHYVSTVSSLLIDFHYRYARSEQPVIIGEIHMKINALMTLMPKFLTMASPRHFRNRLRFAKLTAAIQYLFRTAAIEWITGQLHKGN